jgi:phage terminase large subunit-like protein
LRGEPFLLEPFQKFITYSILGFFLKGTKLRKYKETFIFIPRKNGKTRFIAALSWALSLLERKSGSCLYIVAASLKQSLQSFKFIHFNLKQIGEAENFRILNNNHGHFIEGDLGDGSIHIEALTANPDRQDSLNSNIQILDEFHVYKSATKAYFNVDEFRSSDREYKWNLEELAKLPIDWYGGVDLSKLYDLTAGALYGQYKDIDITVTHAFFPITAAYKKAGIKDRITEIAKEVQDNKNVSQEEAGVEIAFAVLEAFTENKGESAFYDLLSGPFEMKPKDIQKQDLSKTIEMLIKLSEESNLLVFFKSEGRLLAKE